MFLADPTGLLWCFSLCRQCLYNSPPFSLSLRNHLQMVSCETAIFSCFFKYPLICLGDQSSRINPNTFFVPLSHRQRLVLPCADNTYVTKAAAKVKSHLPALRCVGSESRKHELTAVLDELDGKTGYAELIGELDRLLVYYRRTVAVRKGRRSAAKERAKSRTAGKRAERTERTERTGRTRGRACRTSSAFVFKEKFLQIILSKILKNVYFCSAIKIEKNNTYKYII